MATAPSQNWWDSYPVAQPPAASPALPTVIQGPPRQAPLPTPQVPTVEANTRANTVHTEQTTRQSDTRGANFGDENALRQQYRQNPSVQAYESILPIYRAAQTAADNTAGDQQMVYSFAKMMDPGSVVREGEQASVAAAGSLGQRAQGYIEYIRGHGRLTPEMRQQLLREMAARGANLDRDYIRVRQDMMRDAQRYGFDPRAIVGEHAAMPYRQEMGLGRQPAQDRGGLTFWDDPVRPHGFSTEQAQAYDTFMRANPNATAEQVQQFGRSIGFEIHNAEDIVRAREHRAGVAPGATAVEAPLQGNPDSATEALGAGIRGVTNAATAGLDHPLAAAVNTWGPGGSGTFGENLYRENAYDNYNFDNHFLPSVAGNVIGALAVPTGAPGAGRSAATAALRGGATRAEAIAAARGAVGTRLATEGAIYGGVHGTATGEGDITDRITNGVIQAGEGGVLGLASRFGPGFGRTGPRRSALPPLVDPLTGRLNQPLESATSGERVASALGYGINLPLGAATDRGGAILEKGLDVSPVSAGIMNDARRAVSDQTQQAVENVAGNYGTARTLNEAGTNLQTGARNWINRATVEARPNQPSVVGRAYNSIPISPDAPAVLTNTQATLDRLTSRFQSNPELAALEQNQQLVRYRDALTSGGLSWEDQKGLRSIIGDRIGAERFSESPSRNDLRALYAALSEDMRATAAAQGPRALRAFERANSLNRNVENRIEGALVRILGDDSKNSPERAAAAIQTISQSAKGSADLNQLAQIRASLTKGGEWDNVASALIRLGGQPARSEGRTFNPQTFVDWYSGMTEPARALIFGGGRRQALREALDGFVAVNQRLAGTNALRNTSNTTPGLIGAGAVSSAGTAVLAGILSPMTAVSGAAGLAGNYGLARLWTNPSFVRWATGYTRAAAGGASSRALALRRQALGRLARSSPEIADAVTDLDHRLFGDPTPADAQPATPAQ